MNEQEKYWGRTPVLTAHMEAMLKASREYAKMVSNDDETPAQRASRARDFQCGAMWEEGYSKQLGWHPASELPPEEGEYIVKKEWGLARADLFYSKFENGKWSTPQVKWWCYPPKED